MDRASDFELDGETENPVYGGKYCPSSRWEGLKIIHQEHNIYPFHANCTNIAPELHLHIPTKSTGLAARFRINLQYPPTLFSHILNVVFVNCDQLTLNQKIVLLAPFKGAEIQDLK